MFSVNMLLVINEDGDKAKQDKVPVNVGLAKLAFKFNAVVVLDCVWYVFDAFVCVKYVLVASDLFKNVEASDESEIVPEDIEAPDITGGCENVKIPDTVSFAVLDTLPAIEVVSVEISFTFDDRIVAISPSVSNVPGAELIRLLIWVLTYDSVVLEFSCVWTELVASKKEAFDNIGWYVLDAIAVDNLLFNWVWTELVGSK